MRDRLLGAGAAVALQRYVAAIAGAAEGTASVERFRFNLGLEAGAPVKASGSEAQSQTRLQRDALADVHR